MPNFNSQHTDAENSKATPASVARDNDLKVTQRGSLQSIARERPPRVGEGGQAVTATTTRTVK